jgi:uncharacterized membrane protein
VLDVIQNFIQTLKPTVTIIDTIERAMPRLPRGSDQTGAVTKILGPLQQLALSLNVAVLGIDHIKKDFRGDAIDDIMGATAKTAVADCVWAAYRNKQTKLTTLKIIGRDVEEAELALEREETNPGFKLLGDAEEVELSRSEDAVIAAFKRLGETATQIQVIDETGLHSGTVSKIFGRLEDRKVIERLPHQGRRNIPFKLLPQK